MLTGIRDGDENLIPNRDRDKESPIYIGIREGSNVKNAFGGWDDILIQIPHPSYYYPYFTFSKIENELGNMLEHLQLMDSLFELLRPNLGRNLKKAQTMLSTTLLK